MYTEVFSKYEIRKLGVKVAGVDTAFNSADCVGKFEEELDTVIVTKKCRGIEVKKRPRGKGTGKVTFTGHMPYDIYVKMFDMERDDLVEGVQAYGTENFHKEFALTADVYDEDDNELLLAYPRCIIETGPNTTIENGAEEVAEIEVEISIMPDDHGYCRYECIVDDLPESTDIVPAEWLNNWTDSMVYDTTDLNLTALSIGTLTLTPTFSGSVTSYTASTTNTSDAITATAGLGTTVTIKNGATTVASGTAATWESGANTVKVTVTKGGFSKVYTITVTKS